MLVRFEIDNLNSYLNHMHCQVRVHCRAHCQRLCQCRTLCRLQFEPALATTPKPPSNDLLSLRTEHIACVCILHYFVCACIVSTIEPPLVSIVLPVHNGKRYLARGLHGIAIKPTGPLERWSSGAFVTTTAQCQHIACVHRLHGGATELPLVSIACYLCTTGERYLTRVFVAFATRHRPLELSVQITTVQRYGCHSSAT
jgi:hypothetical protein